MGDFNLNWLDKTRRKRLKDISNKYQMTQMVDKPTRLTKSSQTLLDLIFTNKADRITKIYNLMTGLSDHNLTLAARKLTKTRYRYQNNMEKNTNISFISKKDKELIENEIKQKNLNNFIVDKPCEQACDYLMSTLKQTLLKYTKTIRKPNAKRSLPWFNKNLWDIMKKEMLP